MSMLALIEQLTSEFVSFGQISKFIRYFHPIETLFLILKKGNEIQVFELY